jgi:hypothetical protein
VQVPVAAITLKSLLKLMPFESVERIEIDTQASHVIAASSLRHSLRHVWHRQTAIRPTDAQAEFVAAH